MKNSFTKLSFNLLIFLASFFLVSPKAAATEYIEINIDSVSYNDTLIYCSSNDSIKLITPLGASNITWFTDNANDTIYSDSLILPNGFKNNVSCSYTLSEYNYVQFNLAPFKAEIWGDTTLICGSLIPLSAHTNMKGSEIASYQWYPEEGLSNPTIVNPEYTFTGFNGYSVVVTNKDGCQAIDTMNNFPFRSINPTICMVGVGESNKNVIVWNKADIPTADSVIIYKETMITDQYEQIGKVSFEANNAFIDTASNPDIQSNKYKIAIKDVCGSTSEFSQPHKTLHLSINQGQNNVWNLIWENYEGFDVTTYYIYRGTKKDNMELIGTSPASNTQFSDLTAPHGTVYYQIEIVSPNDCSILKATSYSVSRSNIAEYVEQISGIDNKMELLTEIFPNPCSDELTIKIDKLANGTINIHNLNGSLIMQTPFESREIKLDVSSLKSGVYYVQIISENQTMTEKLIKR